MSEDDLRAQLRADPPPGLIGSLDPDQIDALTAAVRAAKDRQRAALGRAENQALSHQPRLVRKALRAVLR